MAELPLPKGEKPKPRKVRRLPKPRTDKDAVREKAREDYDRRVARREDGKPHKRFRDIKPKKSQKVEGLLPWLHIENPEVWAGSICED